jgi:hypothetical protein
MKPHLLLLTRRGDPFRDPLLAPLLLVNNGSAVPVLVRVHRSAPAWPLALFG